MRNLIHFLIRYSSWFVFIFYVLLSCVFLFKGNDYQQSVYLTSANGVSAAMHGTIQDIDSYFHLKEANERLEAVNAAQQAEILNLRNEMGQLLTLVPDSGRNRRFNIDRFRFIPASVMNNSTHHPRNYFTINKGRLDGVEPGMGVVDNDGIVGIVNVAGDHTARIISVLNRSQRFSVKVKGTDFVGSLAWKSNDPTIATVEEIPRHARFRVGDTIVTSGFSTTFPEGIPVGIVMSRSRGADDNYFSLRVRLSSNFAHLNTVRVLRDQLKAELDSLSGFDLESSNSSDTD